MDEKNKIYEERDEFIKKTLQADKIISAPILDTFENHIESSNIKVKKYTYKQKNFILILLFLLCISVGYNFYLINVKNPSMELSSSTSQLTSSTKTNNEIPKEDNKQKNNDSKNNISSSQLENTVISTPSNVTTEMVSVQKPLENTNSVNIEELKQFIEMYSLGINRISYEENTLESNTVLLMIARKYFNSIPSNQISSEMKKSYTFTIDNINKFIREITGKSFVNNIPTYSNYINYSSGSKSYIYGKDSGNLTKEKYSCKNLEIIDFQDSIYTAKAIVERTVDTEITEYEIDLEFKLNSDYIYSQFQVVNLTAKNNSFYPDNTLRLVDFLETSNTIKNK